MPIWVAHLETSPRTAQKIINDHGITKKEVEDAVQTVAGLRAAWHDHPERGLRALIEVKIRNRPVLVVLYERPDPIGDVFNLGSAYFVD